MMPWEITSFEHLVWCLLLRCYCLEVPIDQPHCFTIFFILARWVNVEGNEDKVFAPKKVFRPLSTKVHTALFLVQYEGVSELAGNGVPTCLVVVTNVFEYCQIRILH